jgi:hypothetical protein
MYDVNAGTLHRTDIEVIGVKELHNHHPKYIFIANSFGYR